MVDVLEENEELEEEAKAVLGDSDDRCCTYTTVQNLGQPNVMDSKVDYCRPTSNTVTTSLALGQQLGLVYASLQVHASPVIL